MIANAKCVGDSRIGFPMVLLQDGPHAGVAFILHTSGAAPNDLFPVEYHPEDQFCYVADSDEWKAAQEWTRKARANIAAVNSGGRPPY
jgi:hypothetical protein